MTTTKHPAAANAPLSFECELPDPPEKVWRALTEPE
ncbi:MAG: ATPase, partial [Mesorhizobium sp.]